MKELRALFSGVLLFAVVLAGVIGVAWAVGAEYQDAPETTHSVTDEAISADVGNWTSVDAPNYATGFEDNETITNSTGATLSEGSDYDWNASTGSIYWYDTSSVDDGEAMNVDYTYRTKTETARNLKFVLDVPISIVFPISVFIIVAMSVAGLAAGAYRVLAKADGSNSFNRR